MGSDGQSSRREFRGPLARAWALVQRALRPRQIELVYSPRYRLRLGSTRIDPHRAEKVLGFLASAGHIGRHAARTPSPATLKTLSRVHSEEYLDRLHRPDALLPIVGFNVGDETRERALRAQRAAVGGTVLATRLALQSGKTALNLGGGFHHARADAGAGFCIFNDVAVAIRSCRARGFASSILVIDLDLHDGDGTRAVFADDASVYTFSVHNRHWDETEAVASESIELGSEVEDDAYLETLRRRIPEVIDLVRPELVFYVAGADPAHDDALGDWRISADGMLARDRLVFATVTEKLGAVPIVMVLGGGYGQQAWRYTARTASWLLTGTASDPPPDEAVTLARFRAIFSQLEREELGRAEPAGGDGIWDLSEADIYGDLMGSKHGTRLLGHFSPHGIELVLERCGMLDRLRDLGFRRPHLRLELDNPAGETARVFGDASLRELLIEVRLRRDGRSVPGVELLSIEWLLMQNPRLAWPANRSPLPGQVHPGLGMLRDMMALLIIISEQLDLDGICFVPSHYHLASQGKKYLRFLDPEDEAWFRAVRAALGDLPLAAATAAVDGGRVRDEQGRPIAWRPMLMALAISEKLQSRLDSSQYEEAVADRLAELRFTLAATDATTSPGARAAPGSTRGRT